MKMDKATQALMERMAEEAADRAVAKTLVTLGIDQSNPLDTQKDMATLRELRGFMDDPEMQRDLLHLRKWRRTMDAIERRSIIGALSLMAVGTCALVYIGVKTKFFGLG